MIRKSELVRDESGATLVEFALVVPALMALLMGLFDVGYNMYAKAILEGAMQEAGRNSTIEAADTGTIDAAVTAQVRKALPNASISYARQAYADFSDVNRPEEYKDVNGDGTCNAGEPFTDANGNGVWDLDRGAAGAGGAKDAVVLTATITYDRLFPVAAFIPGIPREYRSSSSTVLRNQPYDINETVPATEECV